jgi:hypothetical protein
LPSLTRFARSEAAPSVWVPIQLTRWCRLTARAPRWPDPSHDALGAVRELQHLSCRDAVPGDAVHVGAAAGLGSVWVDRLLAVLAVVATAALRAVAVLVAVRAATRPGVRKRRTDADRPRAAGDAVVRVGALVGVRRAPFWADRREPCIVSREPARRQRARSAGAARSAAAPLAGEVAAEGKAMLSCATRRRRLRLLRDWRSLRSGRAIVEDRLPDRGLSEAG